MGAEEKTFFAGYELNGIFQWKFTVNRGFGNDYINLRAFKNVIKEDYDIFIDFLKKKTIVLNFALSSDLLVLI